MVAVRHGAACRKWAPPSSDDAGRLHRDIGLAGARHSRGRVQEVDDEG